MGLIRKNNMKIKKHILTVLLSILSFSSRAQNTDAPVPTPDDEKKAMTLADGFEINLFAADPLITKPIQMNFDPAGRLWIACSETYPQIQPGTKARDTVLVLEDDGTGFVLEKVESNGIKNMQARAEHMGSILRIHTNTDEGTTIRLLFPKIKTTKS